MRIIGLILLVALSLSAAPIENVLSFQGKIVEGGAPVDGTRNITFRIYDVATGGVHLWQETHSGVPVVGGLFNVELGSVTAFPSAVNFSEQYWVGVSVGGGAEITPRYKLTSSPYAHNIADRIVKDNDQIFETNLHLDSPISGDRTIWFGDGYYVGIGEYSGHDDQMIIQVDDDSIFVQSKGLFPTDIYTDLGSADHEWTDVYIDRRIYVDGSAPNNKFLGSDGTGSLEWKDPPGGVDSDWTISGSNIYSAVSGNVGIGVTSPTAKLQVEGGTGDGIHIEDTGDDGIEIYDTWGYGIWVRDAGMHGIRISNPTNNGILIDYAGIDAVSITEPATDGVYIDNPGDDGVHIVGPGGAGIEIYGDASTERGILIAPQSTYGDPDTGIVVRNTAGHGIFVDSCGLGLIYSNGITVARSGTNFYSDDGYTGFEASFPDWCGLNIEHSGMMGVRVNWPADDGVSVNYPGGDCYDCLSSRSRFNVTNEAEVFGHAFKRYIVDNDLLGIAAPSITATAHFIEHIGEGRLTDGKCRVDYPHDLIAGSRIDSENPVQVFITPYGDIGRYTITRENDHFVIEQIEGDPSADFAYRIVAKVLGYEDRRVEYIDMNKLIEENDGRIATQNVNDHIEEE